MVANEIGAAELIRKTTDGLLEGVRDGECSARMEPMISYATDLVQCHFRDRASLDGQLDYFSFLVGASFANAVRELAPEEIGG